MNYVFKWKRRFSWWTAYVAGHQYDNAQNKMILYFPDGSIREIKDWTSCEVKLGKDWVLAVKTKMEREAGQSIPLNVDTNA